MVHYPDDDTTELDAPRVVNYRDAASHDASSTTAQLSSDGDEVFL